MEQVNSVQIEMEFEAEVFAIDDNGEDGTVDIELTVENDDSPHSHLKFYDFPQELFDYMQVGKRYNVRVILDEIE